MRAAVLAALVCHPAVASATVGISARPDLEIPTAAAPLRDDNVAGIQQGRTFLLLITGASGEPKYATQFHEQASAMLKAARERFGVPDSNLVYLTEDPAKDASGRAKKSSKENVEQALGALAGRAKAGDDVWIVLIGHGSGMDAESRFNLPGPDVTAADFRRHLDKMMGPRVVFVNAASASGDFIPVLSGPRRTVVTATKTGMERNETTFAKHFVEAFAGTAADVDKDNRVSLLEAFGYARAEVARAYETANKLLTEHAQLDDNGDGVGTVPGVPPRPNARPVEMDGALARTVWLSTARPVSARVAADPRAAAALAALQQEAQAIEGRIEALRRQKAAMDSSAYEKALEPLLIDLAQKNREMRRLEGRAP